MDANHLFDDKEALWLFGERKSDLQEMAAFQFAWKLWSDIMLSGKYHDYKSELSEALVNTSHIVSKMIKGLKLGPALDNRIAGAILTIHSSLTMWIAYNQEQMLSGLGVGKIRKIILYTCHLKYAVFKPNCEFDYEASARKMIAANQFDKKVAFEIMCRFCMEEELKKLPAAEVRKFAKTITFDQRPLAWYWIHYLTNQLHVGIPDFVLMLRGECCLPGFMLTTSDCENWSNIEYFYDRLCDEQDQQRKACEVLANINLNWFLNRFYWKMNSDQWRFVWETLPVEILFVFFRQYQEPAKGWFLWDRIKGMLTPEQFVDLMRKILLEKKRSDWSLVTAMQFWTTIDDQHKKYVLEEENSLIVDNFFDTFFVDNAAKSLCFLYDLLSFAPAEYRTEMILEHGDVLFVSDDQAKIDQIVKLCLTEAEDLDEFKVFLTESKTIRQRCDKLMTEGKFDRLMWFFDTYLPTDAGDFKKRTLQKAKPCRRFLFQPAVWCELERFIDSVHPDDVSEATKAKKRYVLAFKLDSIEDGTDTELLNHLHDIVSRFLTVDEVNAMKKSLSAALTMQLSSFMRHYVANATRGGKFFSAEFLDKLVRWCCGGDGDAAVAEWKRALTIDKVFDTVVKNLLTFIRLENLHMDPKLTVTPRGKLSPKVLSALDEVFRWYFGRVEDAQQYKLDRILAFDDLELVADFNRTAEIDDVDVHMVLVWLLGDNDEQIAKFKARVWELSRAMNDDDDDDDAGEEKDGVVSRCRYYEALLNAI